MPFSWCFLCRSSQSSPSSRSMASTCGLPGGLPGTGPSWEAGRAVRVGLAQCHPTTPHPRGLTRSTALVLELGFMGSCCVHAASELSLSPSRHGGTPGTMLSLCGDTVCQGAGRHGALVPRQGTGMHAQACAPTSSRRGSGKGSLPNTGFLGWAGRKGDSWGRHHSVHHLADVLHLSLWLPCPPLSLCLSPPAERGITGTARSPLAQGTSTLVPSDSTSHSPQPPL